VDEQLLQFQPAHESAEDKYEHLLFLEGDGQYLVLFLAKSIDMHNV
jgi:hypothetical protein